jgi:hypothetical protein
VKYRAEGKMLSTTVKGGEGGIENGRQTRHISFLHR